MIYGLFSVLFAYLAKKDFEKHANLTGYVNLTFSAAHAAYLCHLITS